MTVGGCQGNLGSEGWAAILVHVHLHGCVVGVGRGYDRP